MTAPQTAPKNIVLITVDCWRGDHIGLCEGTKAATPNIDSLAHGGTYFSDAYTCGGWTKIAMTSLFSSTYSSYHNFSIGKFDTTRPTFTEQLQKNGYVTAGFSTNPVCGSTQGFDRGFQQFEDLRPNLESTFAQRVHAYAMKKGRGKSKILHRALAAIGLQFQPAMPATNSKDLVERALHWLEQPRSEPYFLWLHFMDLHWPYNSSKRQKNHAEKSEMWRDRNEWANQRTLQGRYYPGNDRAARWKNLYMEEVEALDRALEPLIGALTKNGGADDFHLIMTGDHGEEFFEHGTWAHSWNQLHREGTHVPLIVRPANGSTINEIKTPISHIDIAPTILDLAGIECPTNMLGKSLHDDMMEKHSQQSPVISEMHGHRNSTGYRLSIRHRKWKYIYDGDRDRCLLFDLETDPDETTNLYDRDDPTSREFDILRLKHVSKGVVNILKGDMPTLGEDITYDLDADPKVVERLRALGYLD